MRHRRRITFICVRLSMHLEERAVISNILVVIMAILALIAFVWCFHAENSKDDRDDIEKR